MNKLEIENTLFNYLITRDKDIDAEHIAKYLEENPNLKDEFCKKILEKAEKFNKGLEDIAELSVWVYSEELRKNNSKKEKNKLRQKGSSLLLFPENYVMVDIETTGLSPKYNEIIEISALRIENNKIVSSFSSLVKPEEEIDDFITELTGITNEMLKSAPKIKDVLKEFYKYISKDDILVGYNINFDINFLYDFFFKELNIVFNNDFIDILRISRIILKNKIKNYKLKNVSIFFKLDINNMHRGEEDCKLTFEVYKNLKDIIINDYGSFDNFIKLRKNTKYIDIKSIVPDTGEIDIFNPCYDRQFVFTGTLEKMTRKEAMQLVVNLGGKVNNGINKDTNFLVIGEIDFSKTVNGEKSSKIIKAEKLKLKGEDIEIISENVFYDMLNLD